MTKISEFDELNQEHMTALFQALKERCSKDANFKRQNMYVYDWRLGRKFDVFTNRHIQYGVFAKMPELFNVNNMPEVAGIPRPCRYTFCQLYRNVGADNVRRAMYNNRRQKWLDSLGDENVVS
tara:strand:+ start:927 stop:1295 length:369 start_codon:yes stop_codon:yes gene_type:complete